MVHSIHIEGNSLSGGSETLRELFHWFMREYLENYSVDVEMVFMDLSDEGVDGWCIRNSDYEFEIQIDEKLSGEELMKVGCHELYHLMQHLLDVPRCEICAYLSEKINLDKFSNHE